MFERLKKRQEEMLALGVPGNDLSVYYNGEEVYRHRAGFSEKETKTPMNGKERYNAYSCSKPVTCAAALQLIEKGKLSLETKLFDIFPEFKHIGVWKKVGDKAEVGEAENPITIEHLFTMTAGFSYNLGCAPLERAKKETRGLCPTVQTVKYLAEEPLLFEPGKRWEYSLCHDVLAAVVEAVSGERFSEYVKRHIFEPLGMENSSFCVNDTKEIESKCAQYLGDNATPNVKNCGKEIMWYKLGSEYESGGAGLVTSVDDYIKFAEALRTGDKILKKETVAAMATDRLTPAQDRSFWMGQHNGYGYGLGVRCKKSKSLSQSAAQTEKTLAEITEVSAAKADGEMPSDFGWGGAAGSFLGINIEKKISFFYAQHVLASLAQQVRSELYKIAEEEISGR